MQYNSPTRDVDEFSCYQDNRFKMERHKVIKGINAYDHLPVVSILKIK